MSLPDLGDPSWLERNGAAFTWTLADHRSYALAHAAILGRRRRWWSWIVIGVFLAAFVAFCVGYTRIADAHPAAFAETTPVFIAGIAVGGFAALTLLILLGVILARRRPALDTRWILCDIRTGVREGVLWLHKHATTYVFTSRDAFVDVTETGPYLVARVNRTLAHVFPRDTLAASPEGRAVLEWFDLHRPKPAPRPTPAAPTVSRRHGAGRRAVTRLWSRYGDPRGTEARADFVALLGLSCLAMVLAIVAGNALEEARPLLGRARPDLVIPAAVVLFLAPALVAAAVRRFRALGRSSLMLVVVFLFAGLPGLLLLMLRRSRFTAPAPHRARLSPWVAGVTGLALACAAAVFLAGHPGPGDMIAGRVLSPAVELAADPRAAAAPMILPDPVPLSGRGASDFLDRLTHRGTR